MSVAESGPFRTKFAASALRMAEKVIEDYGETSGVFSSKLKGVDGLQEGDPAKAGEAILHWNEVVTKG